MIELYPAIDLRAGKVVRLVQGDYGRETVYGDDPVEVALSFVEAGARWVHVVDLDAARSGSPENRDVVAAIAAKLSGRAKVQTGGGVRSVEDASTLARAGVARVVMGSAAIERPELVAQVSGIVPVAVGLDHRDGEVAVHGWTQGTGVDLAEALIWFPTAAVFIVTDIGRDGMLGGPDLAGLGSAAASAPAGVVASGGVSSLDDLRALRAVPGIVGVIAGKAIYEGRFTVAQALKVLGQ